MYLTLVFFARFFTQCRLYLFHYNQIGFLRPFKNDRQVFNTTLVETVFPFLLILAPSDGYRRHLSQGKASHSLLQRRSAPRKVVRLLPDERGRLKTCILSFISFSRQRRFLCTSFYYLGFCSYKTAIPFPVYSFPCL